MPAVQPDRRGAVAILVPDLIEFLEAHYKRACTKPSGSLEERATAMIDGGGSG